MSRLGATASERALVLGLVVFVGAFAAAPFLRLAVAALQPDLLAAVLGAPRTWLAAGRTLATGIASTALATLLGGGFALLLGATDIGGRTPLGFLLVLPLLIPSQVTAIAWIDLLGPSSALLVPLGFAPAAGAPHPLYGFGGISFLLGLEHAPLVFLALRAGLRALPGEAIEAAESAGAAPFRIIRTVVLPMTLPALAAGAALAFVSAIGNFATAALLGIPGRYSVLTVLIYQELAGLGPQAIGGAAVLSLLLGAIAGLGVAAQTLLSRRRDVSWTRPRTSRRLMLGRWRRPLTALAWALIALLVLLPLAALLATALVKAEGLPLDAATITFGNFRAVLLEHAATLRAARNSLVLAGSTAIVTGLAGALLAYLLIWRDGPLARVLGFAAELPYAIPGVVLALAAILLLLRPLPLIGISLYNTLGIILLAYISRFLVLSLRTTVAGYRQIDPALVEAAAIAGARLWRRLVTVVLPLAAPAVAAGAILVFLTALNELTVSALLWSSGNETLGVVVFSLEQGGDGTLSAALSVLVVIATVALMALATLAGRRLPEGVLPWQD
ncbi:MAG TPA: ABC transporter permease subunit [Stellaceae bacterium]|nr:ABC transporter permease subunit [Stellaceae bacterium]